MPNDEKGTRQEINILFFKWIVILLFSLLIFIEIGIYQKEITNFYYLILIIILVAIASEKFDEIKIGNIVELKKIIKEFSEKTDEIMKEIKQIQIQSQSQDQKQNQNQNQTQEQKSSQKLSNKNSNSSDNRNFNISAENFYFDLNKSSSPDFNEPYKDVSEDKKSFNNSNNLIYKHKF